MHQDHCPKAADPRAETCGCSPRHIAKYLMHTSDREFDAMHEIIDKTRKGTEFVSVPKQALAHLLRDHSDYAELKEKRGG